MSRLFVRLGLLIVGFIGLSQPIQAQIYYDLIDLGTLDNSMSSLSSSARAINNLGQITGTSQDASFNSQAFIWQNGSMTGLGFVPGSGGTYTEGRAINMNSYVAGNTIEQIGTDPDTGSPIYVARGFFYNGSTMSFIPTLPGGVTNGAFGLNNAGIVAGYSNKTSEPSSAIFAYIYNTNTNALTELPSFAPTSLLTQAFAINNSDRTVGRGFTTGSTTSTLQAFYWNPGDSSLTAIPLLPAQTGSDPERSSAATAINDSDFIVGISDVYFNSSTFELRQRAFLYLNGGTPIDLGVLGTGEVSEARGINNDNIVVGFSTIDNTFDTRAFIYRYTGGSDAMIDLNTLIDPGLNWTLLSAEAINDQGWIVGYGLDANGDVHGFLLVPVPEPTTMAFVGLGLAAAGAYWYRRRWRSQVILSDEVDDV